ncbi:hypothetical protein DYY67_0487 [Candidatus Nitrosotalea sp. TS]|uniref:hypothetical protein n=1 Tax=Candidatus Nitrosotalea sp. TS TaxID=2341020 RepID=UPI00140DF88B|nr:hypothetical protein [Candidatus Nitrosotalea sp. TS]NHI02448.1 hypothetical protein [Candidatus Nitrosotalea sp. TS]
MSSKLPVVLLLTAVLMASVAVSTIPASNALIQRDYSYLNDQQITVRYGNTKVCGDHMCAPGEWDKLQTSISTAQQGKQTGNATTTKTAAPMTSSASSLCTAVKAALANANTDSTMASAILSKLGC